MATTTSNEPTGSANLKEPGFVDTVVAIFTEPRRVGESFARTSLDARAGLAFLLIFVVLTGCGILTAPQFLADQTEQMRANPKVPAGQQDQIETMMQKPAMKAFMVGMPILVFLVGVVIVALLLHLGQSVMGGRAKLGMTFGITSFAVLISIGGLGTIVRSALVLARDSFFDASTGLGMLTTERAINDPVRAIAESFDLFVLWSVVAAGIALAPAARLTTKTTVTISIIVFVILSAILVGLRMLGG